MPDNCTIWASCGSNSAAKKAQQAADASTALQGRIYDQTTQNNKPFLTTGTGAMNQIANLYGLPTYDPTTGTTSTASTSVDPNASFYRSPDYNFDLSQGIKGVDAGAAARGLLDSGATRKAEIAYAGNLASGQYNTYADRLMKIAGIGQAAANNQASSGQSYANSYGDIITNAATNQGNAGLAGSNAVTSGINSATGSIQKYLNSLSQPNSSSIPLRR